MDNTHQPQLRMRKATLQDLPEIRLPDGFTISSAQEDAQQAWEWIIKGSFEADTPYTKMTEDPAYKPERIWFVYSYNQPMATAACYTREEYPNEAYLHMVGTHPWYAGRRAGKYAVLAALWQARREGFNSMVLSTDDFRLDAIALYKVLGFEPILDEYTSERWQKVESILKERKIKGNEIISLWKDAASTPGFVEANGQPVPSIKAFPVEGSKGAVVVCPGGGYTMKADHEGDPIARMLNDAGISAYVLDYRVFPYTEPYPLLDVQRAIRTVRSMGYQKVGVMGFSAGGHLTCAAATLYDDGVANASDPIDQLSSRPDVFVPCYPVASFAAFRHQGSLANFLGEKNQDNYDLIRKYSPDLHINANTPPAFIWHTADDAVVPVENALILASALSHAGIEFELHVFPKGVHGLGLAATDPVVGQWTSMLQKWLLNHGLGK